MSSAASPAHRAAIRAAQLGLVVNALLAAVKLAAGLLGHTYALVADAVESTADIVASLVVWGGLHIAAQPADDDHPYGHGKAESLAAAVVSLMLVAAAAGIAVEAVREIRTPHRPPAAWTLLVLVGVVAVKGVLSRRVGALGDSLDSTAVSADAGHHLSDAITSAAAFVGIAAALIGSRLSPNPAWAAADDWAALFAAGVIAYNGVQLLRPALHDLMDRMPGEEVTAPVERAARGVAGVLDVEKLVVRRAGTALHVDIHVQADPRTPLDAAHVISGMVKGAIRAAVPRVHGVLVHMEPYEGQVRRGR
ncbi:cation diffusion facilitator family transporter [Roseisolibacter sp. H3M3-2]|uniref:cation diffusion facilitator family transporter n=1 Tax=Roseisolibacter sp. H3M3-2 TaxID=3031323 RepID=UPI0023DCBEA3|nr:cation diffusion facilitator family transporter [Roseisolibacter sp. H3M3-2]MDF1503729.1 cation diffusion facilitator family transporter [Roseisolibacter sp. H3M3-2]